MGLFRSGFLCLQEMKKRFSQGDQDDTEILDSLQSLDLAVEKELQLAVSETLLHITRIV